MCLFGDDFDLKPVIEQLRAVPYSSRDEQIPSNLQPTRTAGNNGFLTLRRIISHRRKNSSDGKNIRRTNQTLALQLHRRFYVVAVVPAKSHRTKDGLTLMRLVHFLLFRHLAIHTASFVPFALIIYPCHSIKRGYWRATCSGMRTFEIMSGSACKDCQLVGPESDLLHPADL